MARIKLTSGLCPICGRACARTLATHQGLVTEAYHCPQHGRRLATPSGMSVAEWAAPPTLAALGEIMGVPVACR